MGINGPYPLTTNPRESSSRYRIRGSSRPYYDTTGIPTTQDQPQDEIFASANLNLYREHPSGSYRRHTRPFISQRPPVAFGSNAPPFIYNGNGNSLQSIPSARISNTPSTVARVASHVDPTQPIRLRLQPTSTYLPPPSADGPRYSPPAGQHHRGHSQTQINYRDNEVASPRDNQDYRMSISQISNNSNKSAPLPQPNPDSMVFEAPGPQPGAAQLRTALSLRQWGAVRTSLSGSFPMPRDNDDDGGAGPTMAQSSSEDTSLSPLNSNMGNFPLRQPQLVTLKMTMAGGPINSTISRDNTAGECARQADLLAYFGTRLRNHAVQTSDVNIRDEASQRVPYPPLLQPTTLELVSTQRSNGLRQARAISLGDLSSLPPWYRDLMIPFSTTQEEAQLYYKMAQQTESETLKTISPRDAVLDFEQDEELGTPLFPEIGQSPKTASPRDISVFDIEEDPTVPQDRPILYNFEHPVLATASIYSLPANALLCSYPFGFH